MKFTPVNIANYLRGQGIPIAKFAKENHVFVKRSGVHVSHTSKRIIFQWQDWENKDNRIEGIRSVLSALNAIGLDATEYKPGNGMYIIHKLDRQGNPWFGESERHSQAAKRGWAIRKGIWPMPESTAKPRARRSKEELAQLRRERMLVYWAKKKAPKEPARITLKDAGITIKESMTAPSKAGKAPRKVWEVSGVTTGYEEAFKDMGATKWRGSWSFWNDPTEKIERLINTQARMTYAEQLEAKQERAAERADRYEDWAKKAAGRSEAAFTKVHKLADSIPLGQPVLVGHHSEGRARADIKRLDSGMRKGIEESKKAEYLERRAEAAAKTASGEHSIDFMQRRIDEAEAEVRKLLRYQEEATRKNSQAELAYIAPLLAKEEQKRDYWRDQLNAVGGVGYSKDTVKPGDLVKIRGAWSMVMSAGPKNINVTVIEGGAKGFQLKYPYAEIKDWKQGKGLPKKDAPVLKLKYEDPNITEWEKWAKMKYRKDAPIKVERRSLSATQHFYDVYVDRKMVVKGGAQIVPFIPEYTDE